MLTKCIPHFTIFTYDYARWVAIRRIQKFRVTFEIISNNILLNKQVKAFNEILPNIKNWTKKYFFSHFAQTWIISSNVRKYTNSERRKYAVGPVPDLQNDRGHRTLCKGLKTLKMRERCRAINWFWMRIGRWQIVGSLSITVQDKLT